MDALARRARGSLLYPGSGQNVAVDPSFAISRVDDLTYDPALKKVLVSSRSSDQIFAIDPKTMKWDWWQTGYHIVLIRAAGNRLIAASLDDGVMVGAGDRPSSARQFRSPQGQGNNHKFPPKVIADQRHLFPSAIPMAAERYPTIAFGSRPAGNIVNAGVGKSRMRLKCAPPLRRPIGYRPQKASDPLPRTPAPRAHLPHGSNR